MAKKEGRLSRVYLARRVLVTVLVYVFLLALLACGRAPEVMAVTEAGSGDVDSDASLICYPGRGHAEEVRRLWPNEWGAPHPLGLSYSLEREHLALVAGPSEIVVITPYEDMVAAVDVSFGLEEDVDVAYDDTNDTLLLLDASLMELGRLAVGQNGAPDPQSLARFDVAHLDVQNASGMAVDEASRALWVLDGGTSRLVHADLDPPFALKATVDLPAQEDNVLRELAVHPTHQHLFVMAPDENELYELTQEGTFLNVYDLTPLQLVDVRGMGFGPSADLTDEPDTIHLFLADSNLTQGVAPTVPGAQGQVLGSILEVALVPDFSDGCTAVN